MIEMMVPSRAAGAFRVAQAELHYSLLGQPEQVIKQDVMLTFTADAGAPQYDPKVMNLVEKVTAFKLQTRALSEAEAGNVAGATQKLRAAATRLLDLATIQARRSDYDETVDTQIEEAWNWLTNDYDDRVEELSDDALFALAAALEALILACDTDRFLGVEISKDMTDANLDMWCSDAAKQ